MANPVQDLTFYQASIPVFIRALNNLSALLHKATAFAAEQGIDESALVNARLAPDMFSLARQVQSASDAAKSCAARLSGGEIPSFPDTETTFAQLQERIAKTIAYLNGLPREPFAHAGVRPIVMNMRGTARTFSGYDYLFRLALPNLFFHVTTAYDILRNQGLAIGKSDYLGSFEE
ncbi:DUF1993 family protein [Sodalis sp. RH21]|uniref:DUF1993 domain-containing protein n=1 Tax=unclassified Sodalis (in: enterobacteria) TaxID=2636512 RepID=UPI0039B4BD9F